MSAPEDKRDRSGASRAPLSRSAVGRASGAISRLFSSASRVQATGQFLRRQLWAWPIIAAVVLGAAGWWVSGLMDNATAPAAGK